jgi:hypothetical protein
VLALEARRVAGFGERRRREASAGSNAPTTSRAMLPVCAMTPGALIVAAMYATPPSTRSLPSSRRRISGASTPFWNGMTTPPFATSGASCGRGVLDVPQLYRQHRDVDRPRVRNALDRLRRCDREIPARALDAQSRAADGLQVPPARDERHVRARLRELAAEVAADGRRRRSLRYACSPHVDDPSFGRRPAKVTRLRRHPCGKQGPSVFIRHWVPASRGRA